MTPPRVRCVARLRARAGRAELDRACRRTRGQGGFSLLELLLGCVLTTLVVAAAVELLRVHVGVARRLQAALAATGGAGWALAVAARDAQLAGADPARTGVVPLSAASGERVVVQSDRDGDGAVDAASDERVTLAWSSTSGGRFVRWLGTQSMSIASLVRAGGLRLRYFDDAGVELAPPPAGDLDAAARDRVRRVTLELDVTEQAGVVEARTGLRAAAALRLRLAER